MLETLSERVAMIRGIHGELNFFSTWQSEGSVAAWELELVLTRFSTLSTCKLR
jgi:hypothetical protein